MAESLFLLIFSQLLTPFFYQLVRNAGLVLPGAIALAIVVELPVMAIAVSVVTELECAIAHDIMAGLAL